MTKYIFITGGVVSSLGKGIAAASLGAILEARGLQITMIKLDPYINVDPGTMSPFQHGEVFVTSDGTETDLDLGHYERFVNFKATKLNNFTTGQIYQNVIRRERRGDYLGKTVQIIPDITDEIQLCINSGSGDAEVCIVEIGGTVGDIESLPFLEAIRQMGIELGRENVVYIHLTLVPYISVSGEMKTKPTQHSVKELQAIGIQPDVLLCRSDRAIPEEQRKKIALFTNVNKSAVIEAVDQEDIYSIPAEFHKQNLDGIVIEKLNLKVKDVDLKEWENYETAKSNRDQKAVVAMVGKYTDLTESYKSLNEALHHAGVHTKTNIEIKYFDSEKIESDGVECLLGCNAIIVPGGFGLRGIEGKIKAVQFAREQQIPFLGICLGMQLAVIEFARHILGMNEAHSTEFNEDTQHPVIAMIEEWRDQKGTIERRDEDSDLGGTMRLGEQVCHVQKESTAYKAYQKELIMERHRHRYEFNNNYLAELSGGGLLVSGKSEDDLVEIIEVKEHPWFLGCQFHPEFTSTPRNGHPLFCSFMKAARQHSKQQQNIEHIKTVKTTG